MQIIVSTIVHAPIAKVWDYWTQPEHITKWNSASDDWHTPTAENDLREGGKFKARMEAKDGSAGFDFEGTYTQIKNHELIEYVMSDERKVRVTFTPVADGIQVTEIFDAENVYSPEQQREGWQAILDNFKKYVER